MKRSDLGDAVTQIDLAAELLPLVVAILILAIVVLVLLI